MRFLIFVYILVAFSACEKYKLVDGAKRLPNATERGRGLFACYIDNQSYIARNQQEVVYNQTTGYLFLENSNGPCDFRLFVFEGIFGEGSYSFDITGEDYVFNDGEMVFSISPGGVNELLLTKLNLEKKIISGEFSLDLVSEDGTEKHIRDGRFDLEIIVHG